MTPQFNWQPGMSLELLEKQSILQAFRFFRGNKTQTAQALGISIRTLDTKFELYKKADLEYEAIQFEHRKKRAEFLERQRGIKKPSDSVYERQLDEQRKRELEWAEKQQRAIDTIRDARGKQPAAQERSVERSSGSVESETKPETGNASAHAGGRVESAQVTAEKQPMPVQERKEVQKVLPRQAAIGGAKGRR